MYVSLQVLSESDDKEYGRHFGRCSYYTQVVQNKMAAVYAKYIKFLRVVVRTLLLVGYAVYFCFAMSFGLSSKGSVTLLGVTVFVVAVISGRIILRKYRSPIRKTLCIPFRNVKENRKQIAKR